MKKLVLLTLLAGCQTAGPLKVEDVRVGQTLQGIKTPDCTIVVANIESMQQDESGNVVLMEKPVLCGPVDCKVPNSEYHGALNDSACLYVTEFRVPEEKQTQVKEYPRGK